MSIEPELLAHFLLPLLHNRLFFTDYYGLRAALSCYASNHTDERRYRVESTRPVVAVVNDDAAFVRLLDTILHDAGYDTLLLQAGEVAYASVKQHTPRVILLDINSDTPQTCWRFVDLLLLDPQTAGIPLIICSVADQTLRDRAPKLRAAGYTIIEKPFPLGEVLEQVRAAIDTSG
jgi:CheY-like chemotaxis protein